jgi:predicted PurR-regulated permease PerM
LRSDRWHRKHMSFFDKRTVRVLSTIVLFALMAGFIYGARRILIVFLFAVLFAYLLEPLVSLVQRRSRFSHGSRSLAILQVYFILLVIISGMTLSIGPRVVDEGRKLAAALPGLLDQMSSGRIVTQLGGKHGWSFDTQTRVQQFFAAHRAAIVVWASDFGRRATMLLANTVWFIVIPILAIFFLRDGREFADSAIQIAERSRQGLLSSIIGDLNVMLAGYIRAQLVLAGLSLVIYTVGLLSFRVPYAIILGMVGGAMEFIPVAGPLVAALVIVGVAFLTGYHHLFLLVLFLAFWRLVQDYVNSPRIMGGKLELHPLAALFAILAGGEIAGVIGVYLSIPVMAALRILWRRWQNYSETAAGGSGLTSRLAGSS